MYAQPSSWTPEMYAQPSSWTPEEIESGKRIVSDKVALLKTRAKCLWFMIGDEEDEEDDEFYSLLHIACELPKNYEYSTTLASMYMSYSEWLIQENNNQSPQELEMQSIECKFMNRLKLE